MFFSKARHAVSRKYFLPSSHLWCRVVQESSKGSDRLRVRVGLTERGLENLGDVTKIASTSGLRSPITEGSQFLKIQWEGFLRTSSDELYHAVWDSIEGDETVSSPVTGTVVKVLDVQNEEVDADSVLAELECTKQDIDESAKRWVGLEEYTELISSQERGKFSD